MQILNKMCFRTLRVLNYKSILFLKKWLSNFVMMERTWLWWTKKDIGNALNVINYFLNMPGNIHIVFLGSNWNFRYPKFFFLLLFWIKGHAKYAIYENVNIHLEVIFCSQLKTYCYFAREKAWSPSYSPHLWRMDVLGLVHWISFILWMTKIFFVFIALSKY